MEEFIVKISPNMKLPDHLALSTTEEQELVRRVGEKQSGLKNILTLVSLLRCHLDRYLTDIQENRTLCHLSDIFYSQTKTIKCNIPLYSEHSISGSMWHLLSV